MTGEDLKFHVEYKTMQDRVRIVCPSGFKLEIKGLEGVLEVLERLARRGSAIHTALSETLFINANGSITVVNSDDWENSKFGFGYEVTNAAALSIALTTAIRGIINGNQS